MWLQRYEEEHDNYRLALSWAMQHPDEAVQQVIVMMTQLNWFWYRCGYLKEGSEWTERMLAATEGMSDSVARANALVARAYLALWSGDLIVAARRAREAVEIGQRLDLEAVISVAKLAYGTALINQGKDKAAYPHLVDAVELFDEQDQSWLKGTTLVHLANVSLGLGQADQALQWLELAMPLLKASGDIWNMAFGLNNYGEVARALGDYERAERFYRQTEALFEQADAKGDQARLVHTFGYIAQHKGKYVEAEALFLQSLKDFQELGNHRGIAECLAGLAGLAAELGEHAWAAPLLSAAESQLEAISGVWWPADRVEIELARERMQSALEDQFDELWAQGETMSVEEAITYAANGG
jgi:tetratricopeptide (TPR) repeat protein